MVILELEIPDLTRGNANGVVELKTLAEMNSRTTLVCFSFIYLFRGFKLQVSGFMGLNTLLWSQCGYDLGLRPASIKQTKTERGDLRNPSHGWSQTFG